MFNNIFKKNILIFYISTCFYCLSFCQDVNIASDSLEYVESKSLVIAVGNVVVEWEGKKIYADHIEFLTDKNILNVTGRVKVEDGTTSLIADSVSYRYDESTGDLKQVFSYSSFMFMHAKMMEGDGKKTFRISNVKFSTCDLENPHTHFRAKHGKLILDKRITIYNAIFYIGNVPVFYLPVVTKSLKGGQDFGTNLKFKIAHNYNQIEGYTLNTTVGCSLSENSFGEFLYDYKGIRGNGYGGKFNYVGKNIDANLQAYSIKDLILNKDIWEIRPNYFQRLNHNWTVRSSANFKNLNSFNSIYNQYNWSGVENFLNSYFTVTRQSLRSNLLLAIESNLQYDTEISQYKASRIKFPSISLTECSRKTFLDIMYTSSLQFNRIYQRYRSKEYFYRNTVEGKLNLARSLKLSRKFILSPSLDLVENWYDTDVYQKQGYSLHTRWGPSLNARYRLTNWIDLNAKYFYMLRTKLNSFKLDEDANDYGIEKNNIVLSNFMFIGDSTTIRNSISYNLRHTRNSKNEKLWSSLFTELIWTPKYNITVFIQEKHSVEPFKLDSIKLDAKIGHVRKSILKYSLIYNSYDNPHLQYKNHEVDNILSFAFWITPKWCIDYKVVAKTALDLKWVNLNTHKLLLYRDLHCYNFGIILSKDSLDSRIGLNYSYKFDLKTNMPFNEHKQGFGYDEPEEMFYPWEAEFPLGL